MPIAAGTIAYDCSHTPVLAHGITLADAELTDALTTRIPRIVHDEQGNEDLRDLLAGLATTQFETDQVERVLNVPRVAIKGWRIGEAIAEAYLVDHRGCEFPWPSGRDLKNPEASPAGADLVGFVHVTNEDLLAFGEVKTSEDSETPPHVMRGRHGMAKQIEGLRDSSAKIYYLIQYLAHHAQNAPWREKFRAAMKIFTSQGRFFAFGVLIRDVAPTERDLTLRCRELANGCPTTVTIELRALYLPAGAISSLPTRLPPRRRIAP